MLFTVISGNIITVMSINVCVKTQKNKDGSTRDYLYLVENFWDKDKKTSKQRSICSLGRIDTLNQDFIVDDLIEKLSKYAQKTEIIDLCKDLNPESAKIYGEIIIFKKLWKDLGFKDTLNKYFNESNKEFNLTEAIFALVCNRLIAPSSKREASLWKNDVYEPQWDNYQLHHFYRALDFLVENKENMELELFNNIKNLFNCKVNVMMFDTTNISYWGEGEHAQDLLKHGHAKNKRNDLKQITIGLIMDQNGVPLGHEVWPGNMSDKTAFKAVIEKIKTKYMIEKVILVADRGMISENNITYLESNKLEYILAVKVRQLSKARQKFLMSDVEFYKISKSLKAKETTEHELVLKDIEEGNKKRKKPKVLSEEELNNLVNSKKGKRRWITCLNEDVAKIDKLKREYFQQIIENKIEFNTAKDWIVKNGYKKYVTIKDLKIELNYERLREDELYDGKWSLITNTDLEVLQLVQTYKDLASIERHFRDLKSELEIGPVYHWTEKRIRAHIFVCFLALQLKVSITRRLKAIDEEISYSEVMRDVAKIKAVTFKVKEKEVIMRTDLVGNAHLAFQAAKAAIPHKLISTIVKEKT